METKELMQFDWVCLEDDPTPRQVDFIRTGEVGLYWNKIVTPPYIKPILLTPEILEKNGWMIKKGFVQHGNFGDGPLMLWHTEENKILRNFTHELEISDLSTDKGFRVRIECNYVHELQHALRLCGIEKEIVL